MIPQIKTILPTTMLLDPISSETLPDEYSKHIEQYISEYRVDTRYIYVGEPKIAQGWILHISIVPSQLNELLQKTIPILLEFQMSFKLIKNKDLHTNINAGKYGKFKIGKIITVFLDSVELIEPLMLKLISATKSFLGPHIFTDFKLSNILYTRYGCFIPIIETDPFENIVRLMKNQDGGLIYDQYVFPPIVPDGVINPFLPFITKVRTNPKTYVILSGKYMPVKVLKSDAKGDVLKSLYFSKYGLPKWCVIKQGRKGMLRDDFDRDSTDRLKWQKVVNNDLKNLVSLPAIIDDFEEENETYIVLKYIKNGMPVVEQVYRQMKGKPWFYQDLKTQRKIIGYILQIISAIHVIHEHGYVHRDITGTNFLVDRKKKIHLIDLELTYSLENELPNPPFGIGTPGFMSPAQEGGKLPPTIWDDIYSLGALMIMLFSGGVDAHTANDTNPILLKSKLLFFLKHEPIVDLIVSCVDPCITQRPQLKEISSNLLKYKDSLVAKHKMHIPRRTTIQSEKINGVISAVLKTIASEYMTIDHLFFASVENEYGWDAYPLNNKHVFAGIYRGVSGVIWLLGVLQENNYDISSLKENIDKGINFVCSEIVPRLDRLSPSLYYGSSGLALMLTQSLASGFIFGNEKQIEIIKNCFNNTSNSWDIIYGLSGQGLAAIQCGKYLQCSFIDEKLIVYKDILISNQKKNGSWEFANPGTEKETVTLGFGYGMAGIVYFLLEYYSRHKEHHVLLCAEKGLNYLSKHSSRQNIAGSWWCTGHPGIALSYLKAYEITGNIKYCKLAEQILSYHPATYTTTKLGQCHGLSGLGEVYLEAHRVTRNEEWWERATWITQLLLIFIKSPDGDFSYWATDKNDFPTAEFMNGNSGILHYLARYANPGSLGFPFFPKS